MSYEKEHVFHYAALILLLSAGVVGISIVTANRDFQMMIVVLTTFFYVLWGIVHHLFHHDLTAKIVIEYILVSLVIMAVFFFLNISRI